MQKKARILLLFGIMLLFLVPVIGVFIVMVGVGLYFIWFRKRGPLSNLSTTYQVKNYSPDSSVSQLIFMGFEQVGRFYYSNKLDFTLSSNHHDSGVYAFVVSEEIKYIGKTHNLEKRMRFYANAGSNDGNYTDRNINQNLISSREAQILFLSRYKIDTSNPQRFNIPPMNESLNYHIVEDILIARYKPPWNYEGSRD